MQQETSNEKSLSPSAGPVLVACVFVIAVCGLVYELIAGALSSYLLGDSVTQFSIVIGLFLTAMGAGSFLSRFVRRDLLGTLIAVETGVGLVGGSVALVGFAVFALTDYYVPAMLGLVGGVGVLVGLEIPLVVRILKDTGSLRITLANVLTADYVGALAASVLFPFLLLPFLGIARAGLVMGLANVAVGGLLLWRLRAGVRRPRALLALVVSALGLLIAGLVAAGDLVSTLENRLYQDEIIYAEDTPHQRLVLTRWRDDVRLYLDGHLQFSSVDEYRYHEALVHPAMSLADRRDAVLILGGGDGLACREVCKYAEVDRVDLVDIDPAVTRLFRTNPLLTSLNAGALSDPRLRIHNEDAMRFLEETTDRWDVVLMDLPDPSRPALGKLYSRAFFNLVGRHVASGGTLGCQCTSPFRSRKAFWCIVRTIESARCGPEPGRTFQVLPYHTVVPTFGTWGFAVASAAAPEVEAIRLSVPTRYLTEDLLPGLFAFPADMAREEVPVSRLDDPVVWRLYEWDYHRYLE